MTGNHFGGDVPADKMLLQALREVTGGVHYHNHYATPEPVVPQLLPPLPRRWRPSAVEFNDEHKHISTLVDGGAQIVALTGPARMGKTTIGLGWAHAHIERWPDGQFWGDLAPDEAGEPAAPSDILNRWLGALGMARNDIPESLAERAAEWRSRTFDKNILLFLDDALSAAQVRCLLPNSAGALTIVTSRTYLSLLHLNGARFVPVGPPRRDEAWSAETAGRRP